MADNIKYRFIQNVGDYFPSGYFSEDFIDKVQKASGVSSDEMNALCAPYVQLRREYEAYKNYIVNTNPRVKDAIKHTHDFNNRLLQILGYSTEETYHFYGVDEDAQSVVPVRQVLHRGNGVSMLVMEMQHLIQVGDKQPSGLFEQRYNEEGDEKSIRHQQYYAGQWSEVFTLPQDMHISPAVINKAIDAIFLLPPERRPHFILMMAGNTHFLLNSEKWNRGAYLQFSLDELFSQASFSSAFRKYYALFHLLVCKETLAADSETVLMDKLVEESYRSAYEVTKDLKDGVVLAVETLANEALYWWQQNNNIPVSDYTDDTFEAEVKDDCLVIIYRLLFIFYAESRDELEILPTNDEVYAQGYSLEMIRDLEKVPLISENSRNGYFFHESLQHLFSLLSSGYHENAASEDKSFSVRHIDSPLFNNKRLKHLAGVKVRNIAWQEIIKALSLSHRNRQVGRISYANLGVNQLGSVYESLLAYRGFYAEEDYIEVHKAGSPEDGTFLVPYSRMDDFEPNEILCDDNEEPIILKKGTFVYRLNGRDRQKSASYYTPEVLTRSTVKYTLKAIIDEVAAGKRKATELLDLKILESAMGAAAFQNEVINQLADAYLTYQQQQKREAGSPNWRIAPDHYRDELQKVKAYIATHNVYGVDLNPTAIELGKLSLWLNVIHKDMETPFFSNRLAVGNAVIGAWLKVYSKDEFYGIKGRKHLESNSWWEKAPHKVRFQKNRVNRSVNEIYHFLLPDKAMLAVRNIAEQKRAHPDETVRMNALIKDWTAPIGDSDFRILQRLSNKIDILLKEYKEFQADVEKLTENKMALWGVPGNYQTEAFVAEKYAVKQALNDVRYRHDNAYFRLKMVMDYWCALWFWEYDDCYILPKRVDYWNDIEAMLDVSDDELNKRTAKALRVHVDSKGQLDMFPEGKINDLFMQQKLEDMVREDIAVNGIKEEESQVIRRSKEEILSKTKGSHRGFFDDSERFVIVKKYADRYHFFHPMLEFLEVFWLRDGFDIICGNPPWIKLEFDEVGIISEKYPEVSIRRTSAPDVRKKRDELFANNPQLEKIYRDEETENVCSTAFLNAYQNYPLLVGQQTNLYKCILTNGMEMMGRDGYMGLLTPETIYDDPNGQPLRRELYKHLMYHFQYQNELRLFAEVHHHTKYGGQLLRSRISSPPRFASLSNLFHPSTVDACFAHDGHGICGGIKDENGNWNTSPHKDRIVEFNKEYLNVLSDVFDDGIGFEVARLVSIHSQNIISVLAKLSQFQKHVSDYVRIITRMLDETNSVVNGTIKRSSQILNFEDGSFIYSGPHITLSNPISQNPRINHKLSSDYDNVDLNKIENDFVPRTLFKPVVPLEDFRKLVTGFIIGQDDEGRPITDDWMDHYKLGFREFVGATSERTLTGAILSPNCQHLGSIVSITFRKPSMIVELAGLTSSVVLDFYMKTTASSHVKQNRILSFPLGIPEVFQLPLYVRTLMLNSLTKHYANLWVEMWREEYKLDSWSKDDIRLKPFSSLTEQWQWKTPLRNYFERRQALVEIDVIAAMSLGLSLQDLEMIYTIQFPVLQQNENDTWYDAKGNIVFTCSKGLTGVGLDRKRNNKTGMLGWEDIRGEQVDENTYAGIAPTHTHTIDPAKSELYGGQQQTFVAPYTRCDRIADYRTAWAHFEKIFNE